MIYITFVELRGIEWFIEVCIIKMLPVFLKVAVFNKSGSFERRYQLCRFVVKGFWVFNELPLSATFCHFLPLVATFLMKSGSVVGLPRP